MENVSEQLGDKDVDDILVVCGKQRRKRKRKMDHLTPEYQQRLKTLAMAELLQWISNEVPENYMIHLVSLSSRLPQLFGLKTQLCLPNDCVGEISSRQELPVPPITLLEDYHVEETERLIDLNQSIRESTTNNKSEYSKSQPVLNHTQNSSNADKQQAAKDDEEFDAFEGTPVINLTDSSSATNSKPLSFKRILCHWAASTMQKKSHLTYSLQLLKEHRPPVDYDTLPSSGKQLMFIDGRDMPQPSTTSLAPDSTNIGNRKKHPLPPVINLDNEGNGRYTHFGLESALAGDSPGVYFHHADLLQYADIYQSNPNALPPSIRKKIEKLHGKLEIAESMRLLRGETTSSVVNNITTIPHFEADLSCDGVLFFDNSEQAECIPICVVVHSEIKRLDPNNDDNTTIGRQFTVSIRCVIADWPMRSYLKRVKGHTGYWSCERCIQRGVSCEIHSKKSSRKEKPKKTIQFLDVNAPPRTDEEFLSYCKSDDCPDEHLNGHEDLSPFLEWNFPMVSGFVVEPMHTFYAGCVGGRLKGIAGNPNEGQLSSSQLKQVDQRLELFEKCKPSEFERHVRSLSKCAKKYKHHEIRDLLMYIFIPVFTGILQEEHLQNVLLLQYAMLLIGGFSNEPVSNANVTEASRVLKLYVQQLKEFKYPIRPTTHFATHLPEDAVKYGCGVETLSAFVFENFYRFFRNILLLETYRWSKYKIGL
ncbi:Uncharacterized protein APZ42_034264 [Daphnia magna]|uniref:Uncharacterized protein n=1 Tax=Daphnia magna TaxID=35525 RepID=A0A164KA86_9CRUS|nr:Uncharacterized protein APZ42_034264 [Daphnia magna]